MPIGYIFDLDGVITDTAEFHYRAWQRLADEVGVPFTREDNEALRGVSRRRSLEILLKGRELPELQMQELMARKNTYYRDLLKEITPEHLLPGARQFLEEARSRGIKIGLASASKNAHEVCARLGIRDRFDVLGDGYSVTRTKPDPDLFIWVAGGLGIRPRQCVVFEDAAAGIQAALSGGFWAVGIGPKERVGKAHWVISRLGDAHPDDFTFTVDDRDPFS